MVATLLFSGLMTGCSPPSPPKPASDHPLPECPPSPNCVRSSASFEVPADTLYEATLEALDDLGPHALEVHHKQQRARAVYRVALLFKDDVGVVIQRTQRKSILHARSASRVGYSDLGVNTRRMNRLLRQVRSHL